MLLQDAPLRHPPGLTFVGKPLSAVGVADVQPWRGTLAHLAHGPVRREHGDRAGSELLLAEAEPTLFTYTLPRPSTTISFQP